MGRTANEVSWTQCKMERWKGKRVLKCFYSSERKRAASKVMLEITRYSHNLKGDWE